MGCCCLQVGREQKRLSTVRDGEDVDQPHGTRSVNHHDSDGDMLAMHQLASRVSQCGRSNRAESPTGHLWNRARKVIIIQINKKLKSQEINY